MNEKKVLVFDTKVNVNNLAEKILRKEKEIIRLHKILEKNNIVF